MNISKISILLVAFWVISCAKPQESGFSSFTNEVFPDLDIATLQNLETPYETVFATSGGRLSGTVISLADISTKLNEIFREATVLEAEPSTERGIEIWEIKLKMATGGIVKLDFAKEIGEIIKIKGQTGPFDYEIDPQGSFITFSEARQIALDAVGGEIKKWSLELEENNEWEYEFHTVGDKGRFEVEVKGFEATVLTIKEKAADQDEDNDGVEEGDKEHDGNDDGNDEDSNTPAPEAVVLLAKSLFEGNVVQSEKHTDEESGIIWKLYLENTAGAVVKFSIAEDPLAVEKAGGEQGPFTYNIEINDEVVSLAAALDKVFTEVEGELTQWELKREHEMNTSQWQYEFEVTGTTVRYEIKMNAETGELIKVEEDD